MIKTSDVKVYLKAVNRGHDCINKWTKACERTGLDYVFALRGWGGRRPEGNPIEVFDWDAHSPLRSEIEQRIATSGKGLLGADLISQNPVVRGVGMAHCLPFWHNDRKYTINIDADDLDHEKDLGDLLLAALDVMDKSNTPVLSYDMHLSISDDKIFGVTIWPHVWCFGICLAETKFMKDSINTVLTKPWHAYCAWQHVGGINIDLALDRHFQYHFKFPISFITKKGRFIHRPPKPPCPHGPLYHYYDQHKDFVIKDYRNWPGIGAEFYYREVARHPRTKVIDI
jgi:hypothetical protein